MKFPVILNLKAMEKGMQCQVANSLDYIANYAVTSTRKLLVFSINVKICMRVQVHNPQASSLNVKNEGITLCVHVVIETLKFADYVTEMY